MYIVFLCHFIGLKVSAFLYFLNISSAILFYIFEGNVA